MFGQDVDTLLSGHRPLPERGSMQQEISIRRRRRQLLATVVASMAACAYAGSLGASSVAARIPTLAPATAICEASVGGAFSFEEGFLNCTSSTAFSTAQLEAAQQLCVHGYETPSGGHGLFFATDTSWLCDLTPR
jgi:hypothetical protein